MTAPSRDAIPAAPEARPTLGDGATVALAVAVCAGAYAHPAIPLVGAAASVVLALVVRHPALVVVAGFAAASVLGTRAMGGLAPAASGPFAGTVTLVSDPQESDYGVRVDVRDGHRRLELRASGAAAGAVTASLAGESLRVVGRVSPAPADAPWLVPRHVVGRLQASEAERTGVASAPWRAANRFRRLLDRGSLVMDRTTRSLFGGFVIGDDRGQPPEVVDDFRGSGLTHVLVVSGQNVALALVLFEPLSRRLGWRGRWLVTLGVIGSFGLVTRFEPSVLRASAMAALAVTGAALGRPVPAVRLLALAVAGLVLVDPLLTRSVAFQLSAGASAGLVVLARPLSRRLPGPRLLREALGVTVAAQAGVAPVLLARFGGLPVVSLPANVVAVPVAGLVTTWGLPAGVVAGIFGSPVADVVHWPTRASIGWVAAVARVGASLPLGSLEAPSVVVLAVLAVLLVRSHREAWRRVALVAALAVLLLPAVALRSPPRSVVVADGAVVGRADGATVVTVTGRVRPGDLMAGLREAGVRRIDVLVVPAADATRLARVLRHRWTVARVAEVVAR